MPLTILVASVNYSDFLRLTLPTLTPFGKVYVVTSWDDPATKEVAHANGAAVCYTDSWYKDGATFNKAAALNDALRLAADDEPLDWVLSLDSDIMLPPPKPGSAPLETLHPAKMYGVRRLDCIDMETFERCNTEGGWFDLPMIPLPSIFSTPKGPRLWGHRLTANPIAVQGYFQLWNQDYWGREFKEYSTAAHYDVEFALRWADTDRMLIPWPDYTAVHLGEARLNWKGRTTPEFATSELDYPAFCRAAEEHYRDQSQKAADSVRRTADS